MPDLGAPVWTCARSKDFRRVRPGAFRARRARLESTDINTWTRGVSRDIRVRSERVTRPPGLRRASQSLDFNKCVTQLHRERTEQVTAVYPVADLARLLEGSGSSPNASRTDRLRGAPQLVRCQGQCRKVAGARGNIDLPFHLDCRFAEFPQQRLDGGAIIAEPSRKDIAIDCGGGFRPVRRATHTGLALNGQPAFQRGA